VVSYFFVDTSALAKRYTPEVGTQWLLTWVEPVFGHTIAIAEITTVEMVSVLARHTREGKLSQSSAEALQEQFFLHAKSDYLT
jgi:uncharacterized protein